MSFKRDGNDSSLLANLQKRMIGDLLSSHIPSNEAKLLSNGRYTCTVCPYRPVFDTIGIMAIHRKGRKHLQNLAQLLHNKSNESNKEHIDSSKVTDFKPKSRSSLSIAKSPYSSCCNKRMRPTDRKISLHVGESAGELLTDKVSHSTPVENYIKCIQTSRRFQDDIESARTLNVVKIVQNENRKSCSKASSVHINISRQLTKDELEKNQRSLELFKNGWVLNSECVWVKDANAEFDSDEETPPKYHGIAFGSF
ncbi:hypothetical protein CHUAL_004714 [Chamberlinius hualienensis]